MAKRIETLEIEKGLERLAREKRWYGCEEITIGFYNNGHGNEICDYMLMDSKGIIRCYEIKVTKQDLKSNAKKSWYGNFNYLVISDDLRNKLIKSNEFTWDSVLPDGVGLMVGKKRTIFIDSENEKEIIEFTIIINSKKRILSENEQLMLSNSMVRSMNYKVQKYKDSKDLDYINKLKKESRYFEKCSEQEKKENLQTSAILSNIQWHIRQSTRLRIKKEDLKEIFDW